MCHEDVGKGTQVRCVMLNAQHFHGHAMGWISPIIGLCNSSLLTIVIGRVQCNRETRISTPGSAGRPVMAHSVRSGSVYRGQQFLMTHTVREIGREGIVSAKR